MIESIKIRDFRGIKSGTIGQFKKINLLVGPNNSGKSAVLEAIYLACTASRLAGMTDEKEKAKETKPYDTTVVEKDLLSDHAMQRVWAKHGYGVSQDGLSEWDGGQVKVHQKDKEALLPDFAIYPGGGFDKGDELFTAVFGLESADRVKTDADSQLNEINSRIIALRRELETPFDEHIAGPKEEQENQRDRVVEPLQEELAGEEAKKGELEEQLRKRRERINRLADKLMREPQNGFAQSRLIYCWHPSLSYKYISDAAWIIKGQIPSAAHTIFYDISKITGQIPLEFVRENFLKRPDRLQKLTQSFGRIFGFEQCAIQFQSAPEDNALSQAWVSANGQVFVPIDAFGDGARSIFKLLVALYTLVDSVSDEEPGVLIWEEPELFQHPRTLGTFLSEVISLINDKAIQLFVASHSLESLAHFTSLAAEDVINREELLAFRLNLSDGLLSSSWFSFENLETWLGSGLDPRVWGDFKPPLQFYFQEN